MTFEKSIHKALWGEESWEISARPEDSSRILDGAERGKALRDVYAEFPLLFKVIDAKRRLSVQVHPNERTVVQTGGEAKNEMWCLLEDGPIYAGLRAGTSEGAVAEAVATGRFEELLVRHEARKGDVFFIPGGLVHAIGDGVRLYEVQQSSDTTFRLYDWGRVGADGRPRELHVEKARQAIDYSLPPPRRCAALKTPYFDFWQERGAFCREIPTEGGFLAVYCAEGEMHVGETLLRGSASCLVLPRTTCRIRATSAWALLTRFGQEVLT